MQFAEVVQGRLASSPGPSPRWEGPGDEAKGRQTIMQCFVEPYIPTPKGAGHGTHSCSVDLDRFRPHTAVKSRKCIRWHIPVHAIFAVFFFIYFSYRFYLGHLSLLGLQTKTRRQRNSSTFCSFKSHNLETFMRSAATAFVHATLKRSQKVPRVKSGTFWFPRMDSHDSSTIL